MFEILLTFLAWAGLIDADPVVLIYQSLAAVHALAALHHKLADDRPMALCYGLASKLYLLLAVLHGAAH
jgi:hypothetical protein